MHEGQVIAEAIHELLQWLRENKHAATKQDLRETEARIIAAIGKLDAAELTNMRRDLKGSAQALEKAVEQNKST